MKKRLSDSPIRTVAGNLEDIYQQLAGMPSIPPDTIEEILASATVDPAFEEALAAANLPPNSSFTISTLKQRAKELYPPLKKSLEASRPALLTESEHRVPLRDGWLSRIIVTHPTSFPPNVASPLIMLLHGGGHVMGYPERELPLARELALAHNATVICPSYRLGPEFPFPFSICDSWEVLEWAAREARKLHSPILPNATDARAGFIVGGTSSGANLAASLAHLARNYNLQPPLTGSFLSAGNFISPDLVPQKYKEYYLSWLQCSDAPMIDIHFCKILHEAFKPDQTSKLWAPFDQHHPADEGTDSVKYGHVGLPPTYFQVCGLDIFRDDSLIYERVLREESAIPTRLDLYIGWGHCFWNILSNASEMAQKRRQDSVDAVAWLLEAGKKRPDLDMPLRSIDD